MDDPHSKFTMGDVSMNMNENEVRQYIIMQYAVKKQLKPICEQVTKNTIAISYLKWVMAGMATLNMTMGAIFISYGISLM